jgi:hypothetical protein
MKTKIKYAQSPFLKWVSQDFDHAVESMLSEEEISQGTPIKILELDEAKKIKIIELAIENISDNLCDMIFEAIRDEITKEQENNGN